jgi:hypothetical protein
MLANGNRSLLFALLFEGWFLCPISFFNILMLFMAYANKRLWQLKQEQ